MDPLWLIVAFIAGLGLWPATQGLYYFTRLAWDAWQWDRKYK